MWEHFHQYILYTVYIYIYIYIYCVHILWINNIPTLLECLWSLLAGTRADIEHPGLIVITSSTSSQCGLVISPLITDHMTQFTCQYIQCGPIGDPVKLCPRQVPCLYEGQSVSLFYFQVQCHLLAGFIVGNFSYFPVRSTLSVVTIKHFSQSQSNSMMLDTS